MCTDSAEEGLLIRSLQICWVHGSANDLLDHGDLMFKKGMTLSPRNLVKSRGDTDMETGDYNPMQTLNREVYKI